MTKITVSVPITREHERLIKRRVESGLSATKAHAIRQALDKFLEEDWLESLRRAEADAEEGRIYFGDIDRLAKKVR